MKDRSVALVLVMMVGLSGLAILAKAVAATTQAGETTVYYDGRLGTLPAEQDMLYASALSGPTQTLVDGGVLFNTLIAPFGLLHQAGYAPDPALLPLLRRTIGYTVTVAVQILEESHSNNDRAGFSLLVLSDDVGGNEPVKGLELAFWEDEIWAQNDATQGGYFTHGEGVSFNTTTAVTTYTLRVITDTYHLAANSMPLLSGPIRDYTGFEGTIDPYETPNIIALGDNTTSAGARIQLNYVAVSVPTTVIIEPEMRAYLPVVVRP